MLKLPDDFLKISAPLGFSTSLITTTIFPASMKGKALRSIPNSLITIEQVMFFFSEVSFTSTVPAQVLVFAIIIGKIDGNPNFKIGFVVSLVAILKVKVYFPVAAWLVRYGWIESATTWVIVPAIAVWS